MFFRSDSWRWTAVFFIALACGSAEREPRNADKPAVTGPRPVTLTSLAEGQFAADKRAGYDIRIIGQEPGWYLTIDNGHQLVFQTNAMDDSSVAAVPNPTVDATGAIRYEARVAGSLMQIELTRTPCVDPIGDQAFDLRAVVAWADSTYVGCGKTL